MFICFESVWPKFAFPLEASEGSNESLVTRQMNKSNETNDANPNLPTLSLRPMQRHFDPNLPAIRLDFECTPETKPATVETELLHLPHLLQIVSLEALKAQLYEQAVLQDARSLVILPGARWIWWPVFPATRLSERLTQAVHPHMQIVISDLFIRFNIY